VPGRLVVVMAHVRTWRLVSAGLALFVALAVLVSCGGRSAAPARPGAGCARIDSSITCNVLFVGNSYTAVNNLPAMFTKLAASGGLTVATKALDPGGTTLADHLAARDTAEALKGSTWNVVVLQDQSQIPSVESLRQSEIYPAASALVGQIREVRRNRCCSRLGRTTRAGPRTA
jgi:ABC-type amino acid transport substrate-binding protein